MGYFSERVPSGSLKKKQSLIHRIPRSVPSSIVVLLSVRILLFSENPLFTSALPCGMLKHIVASLQGAPYLGLLSEVVMVSILVQ